ncbi:MAG: RluA family pseudouridine synthase [Gammaproteobacteria bacterium]|nr:RluA family pseudouridine synthase [Gammaproteobacteria bacterium]
MIEAGKERAVSYLEVDAGREGQRIDNFLTAHLKGVPRSHIYRLLRTGQVRVNKGRIQATYRLKQGDVVRVPPVSTAEAVPVRVGAELLEALEQAILYEDSGILILDKPAGLAVHGGSGLRYGLIEILRELRPNDRDITLVHRLDRDTSGCLLVAKDRRLLPALTEAFRRHEVEKRYLTLVRGRWKGGARTIRAALTRARLQSGERMVQADDEGREAETRFTPVRRLPGATLMEASIRTGRTHQIRVHAAALGHPVAGDEKYGDPVFNQAMRRQGLKRMFLHAHRLALRVGGERIEATAELPPVLARVVLTLAEAAATGEERGRRKEGGGT